MALVAVDNVQGRIIEVKFNTNTGFKDFVQFVQLALQKYFEGKGQLEERGVVINDITGEVLGKFAGFKDYSLGWGGAAKVFLLSGKLSERSKIFYIHAYDATETQIKQLVRALEAEKE